MFSGFNQSAIDYFLAVGQSNCRETFMQNKHLYMEGIVTVQTGLRIYCADRKKTWRQQASGPSRSNLIGRMQ